MSSQLVSKLRLCQIELRSLKFKLYPCLNTSHLFISFVHVFIFIFFVRWRLQSIDIWLYYAIPCSQLRTVGSLGGEGPLVLFKVKLLLIFIQIQTSKEKMIVVSILKFYFYLATTISYQLCSKLSPIPSFWQLLSITRSGWI